MTVVATTNQPLWMQDLTYPARIDRQVMRSMWTEGVVSGLGLRQRAEGANMSVDLLAGSALVDGDDQTGQGSYLLTTDGKVNIPFDNAAAQPRVDLIILRVNDPQAGGGSGTSGTIEYLAGAPAATPSPVTLPNSAIEVGRINVRAGASNVVDADIDTTLRGRSGPRSLSGSLLVIASTPPGADYARSDPDQQVSGDVGNVGFTLVERSLVRFDAHMTAYGTVGKSVITTIKANKGTAAITTASQEIGYARGQFDATGATGAVSPRPWVVRVLDPSPYRVGFWCQGTAGYNFTIFRSRDIPQLIVTNLGATSRPVTFP